MEVFEQVGRHRKYLFLKYSSKYFGVVHEGMASTKSLKLSLLKSDK